MNNRWIFNKFYFDFWALWGGAFILIFALQYAPHGNAWGLVAFLAYVMFDTGHVYVTALRTYLDPTERITSRRYWVVPALLFTTFFLWAFMGIPYLWALFAYATFYHNTKQNL